MHQGVVGGIKLQQLVAKVNMCQEHATAAESLQAQYVQRLLLTAPLLHEVKVDVVLVGDDFAASEAPNWDNHRFSLSLLFFVSLSL